MDTVNIIDEIGTNFLDGSDEINIHRSFPNAFDGLKEGQRACLWEMWSKKYLSSKPHVKSAKISGGVIATWHPHGDAAIYETFVNMGQPFSNNLPTVNFHGNVGSVILGGDQYAASRYTEARLSKITEEGMLKGIDKDNVNMILNFSEDEEWPEVFPAVFPNLLVNGTKGIGVSIANLWIPHSFSDTARVIKEYLKTGEVDYAGYLPDLPTGCTLINPKDAEKINKTGRGKVIVEAKYKISGKNITFTEFPYKIWIVDIIAEIKDAIENEKIVGIKNVVNKSGRSGLCLVIECSGSPEKVLEQLFQNTSLREQYDVNQNCVYNGEVSLMNLKDILDIYKKENVNCINREFTFEYNKTMARINILNGLLIAIKNIDEVIEIVRYDQTPAETLKITFDLNDEQVKAILDMKIAKLSSLEIKKLETELEEKTAYANYCKSIIDSESKKEELLLTRLESLVSKFGEPRRTVVLEKDITKKKSVNGKVIANIEKVAISINQNGYVKCLPINQYKKDMNDNLIMSARTDTSDMLLLFSSIGKMYRVSVQELYERNTTGRGIPIKTLLTLQDDENIVCGTPLTSNTICDYIYFATKNGMIKRTALSEYAANTRNLRGSNAMNVKDGDSLVSVGFGDDDETFLFITKNGYSLRINAADVSMQGKTAGGVRGITLREGDEVVKCISCNTTDPIIIISENGKGRKIKLSNFIIQNRAGKGSKCGGEPVACVLQVPEDGRITITGEKHNTIVYLTSIKYSTKTSVGNYLLKEKVLDCVKNI